MRLILVILLALNFSWAQELKLLTPQGSSFSLRTTEGKLSSEGLKGKNVFLFLGFSRCPDVCPLTLRRLKSLAQKLSESERKNFRFLFISVDTERDDLTTLKALKKTYGDAYIGATGSDQELTNLAASFGARFRRFKTKQGQLIVDHTDSIFFLNKEGNWAATLPHGSSVQEMLKLLRSSRSISPLAPHPERSAKLLMKVDKCNLSEGACSAVVGTETFTLALSPRPVTAEKKFSLLVKTNAKSFVPREIDFEGISLNMGYLRPKLTQVRPGIFSAEFKLPVCELPRMDWRVRLIVVGKTGKWAYVDYILSTFE